jgi:hypothetical protein
MPRTDASAGRDRLQQDGGWNPRLHSIPDLILKELRRAKGDRNKVFTELQPEIWDYVGTHMVDGTKRTVENAEKMLKYRIARTDWDFAPDRAARAFDKPLELSHERRGSRLRRRQP